MKAWTVRSAEAFGRTRLSQSFFMRDFLYSEIAIINGMVNLPDDPKLAIAAGRGLCENLLEPWQAMAWWVHDHLPYSELQFFPKLGAFNIGWHEAPKRTIYSFIHPVGYLTKPGFPNHDGDHADLYEGFPQPVLGKRLQPGVPARARSARG